MGQWALQGPPTTPHQALEGQEARRPRVPKCPEYHKDYMGIVTIWPILASAIFCPTSAILGHILAILRPYLGCVWPSSAIFRPYLGCVWPNSAILRVYLGYFRSWEG